MRDSEHDKLTAEQQLRRLERRERWENIYLPVLLMSPIVIGLLYLAIWHTKVFAVISALIGAVAMPFIMMMSRK